MSPGGSMESFPSLDSASFLNERAVLRTFAAAFCS